MIDAGMKTRNVADGIAKAQAESLAKVEKENAEAMKAAKATLSKVLEFGNDGRVFKGFEVDNRQSEFKRQFNSSNRMDAKRFLAKAPIAEKEIKGDTKRIQVLAELLSVDKPQKKHGFMLAEILKSLS